MNTKIKFHPVVITAVALWTVTGAVAALDWDGISLRRIIALAAASSAVTLLGLAFNNRRLTVTATRFVGRAIVRAPRQAWWHGYGTCAEDTLRMYPPTTEEATHDLAGR